MVKDIRIIILTLFMSTVSCFAYPLDNKNTAGHLKDKIDSMSLSMNVNSKLLFIKSDTVDVKGISSCWTYCYVTIDTPKYFYFPTTRDNAVFDSISYYLLIGPRWISHSWIDSDSALAIAEQQGGSEFRSQYPDYRIQASLGEPLVPDSYPVWYITYISNRNQDDKKLFIIDATRNNTPTNVNYFKNIKYNPAEYFLFPNYPNPFNPSTTILYNLPERSEVEISIYNLLGKRIKSFFISSQVAGIKSVVWNGKDESDSPVSSGVYICRLKAKSLDGSKKVFDKSSKLVLMK